MYWQTNDNTLSTKPLFVENLAVKEKFNVNIKLNFSTAI